MALLALVQLAGLRPAAAAPVTVEGITFSDERGDFTILKVTGTGTLSDPFIIVEEVTGGAPILVIRGFNENFGNRIGSQHVMGMAITKMVINHTDASWNEYRLELRTTPDSPSTYGDGLSFAQGWAKKPAVVSSNFHHVQETDEPYDAIDCDQGKVEPDKAVSFDFFITDMTPKPEIFLLQEPVRSVACASCGRATEVADWMMRSSLPPAPSTGAGRAGGGATGLVVWSSAPGIAPHLNPPPQGGREM